MIPKGMFVPSLINLRFNAVLISLCSNDKVDFEWGLFVTLKRPPISEQNHYWRNDADF